MAAIMTKRGNADNILTYEFVCDSVADLAQLDPQYVTMGSTAIIIDGDAGFEIYMANGQKRWVNLGTGEVVAQPGDQEEEEDNFDGGEDVLTGFWTQEEIDTYGHGAIYVENLNLSNHRISGKISVGTMGPTKGIYVPLHMNTNLSYPTWDVQDDPDSIQLFPIIKTSKNNYAGGYLVPMNQEDTHAETVVMIIQDMFEELNTDDSLKNATTLYFAKTTSGTIQSYHSFIGEQEDPVTASNEFFQSLPVVATYDLSNLLIRNPIDLALPDIIYSLSEEQIEENPFSSYIRSSQANIEINNQTITGNIVLHKDLHETIILAVGTPLAALNVGILNPSTASGYWSTDYQFLICALKTNQNNLIYVSSVSSIYSETYGIIGIAMQFDNTYVNDSFTNSTELQFYRCDNIPNESKVSLEAFMAWLTEQTPTVVYDISGVQFLSELDFCAPVPKVGDGMDYLKAPEHDTENQRNIAINNHIITGEVKLYNYESDYAPIEFDFNSNGFKSLLRNMASAQESTGILPALKTSNNNLLILDYLDIYNDYMLFVFNNEQVDDSFSNVTELQFYRVDTPLTNVTSEYIKTLPLVSVYDMSNVSFIDMENWENGGNDV